MGNLTFVYGRSGSGKTTWIINSIQDKRKDSADKKIFCIVPEQYVYSMEKALIHSSSDDKDKMGILYTDVLGFTKLAYKVFGELGHENDMVMTEVAKCMLIRHIIDGGEGPVELSYFGKKASQKGYISNIKSFISELRQYNISPERLDEIIEAIENDKSKNKGNILQLKLKDISEIYHKFNEYLDKNNMMTSDGVMSLMLTLLQGEGAACRMLDGCDIYIDGFRGFSVLQYKVIEELMKRCDNIYVTAMIDRYALDNRRDKLFNTSRNTISRIKRLAEAQQINMQEIFLDENSNPDRFNSDGVIREDLKELESDIFRYHYRKSKAEREKIEADRIVISAFPYAQDEINYCISAIRNLMINDANIRYKDFAIICGDLEGISLIAQNSFERAGLSVFVDEKRDIKNNAFIDYVFALLMVIYQDFDYKSVMKLLRSGFMWELETGSGDNILAEGLNVSQKSYILDKLDNFLLASGIRGHGMWNRIWDVGEFDNNNSRKGKKKNEHEDDINSIRERLNIQLSWIYNAFKKENLTVKEYCIYLVKFLQAAFITEDGPVRLEDISDTENAFKYHKVIAEKKLADMSSKLKSTGEIQSASEYRQIYGMFINALEDMVDLLGDKKVNVKEFYDLLMSGLEECKIGTIPEEDGIFIGDITRTRLDNIKYLFVIGASDNSIPKVSSGGGIINDDERIYLTGDLMQNSDNRPGENDNKVELAPTTLQKLEDDQFYLYMNITKPSEGLFITYSELSADGKKQRPSYVINRIQNILPRAAIEENDRPTCESILGNDYGMTYVINGIRNINEEASVINSSTFEFLRDFYKDVADKLQNSQLVTTSEGYIDSDIAFRLYSDEMEDLSRSMKNVSISQMEQFATCEYAYFLKYGLGLQERKEHEISSADIGNILQDSLNELTINMQELGKDWADYCLGDEYEDMTTIPELDDLSGSSFNEVIRRYTENKSFDSNRYRFIFSRYGETFRRTAQIIAKQMKLGSYRTYKSEFEYNIATPVSVHGYIDRVDVAEGDVLTYDQAGDVIARDRGQYLRIFDYKTGIHSVELSDLYYGIQMQMVIYLSAATEKLEQISGKIVIPAGIFYYNIKDDFESISSGSTIDYRPEGVYNASDESLVLMDHNLKDASNIPEIKSNAIVYDKKTTRSGEKVSEEAKTAQEISIMADYGKYKLKDLYNKRTNGGIHVNPYAKYNTKGKIDRSSCGFCPYGAICGFDKTNGKYVNLSSKNDDEIIEMMKKDLEEAKSGLE